MKSKKNISILLPIGLLLVSGVSFITHLAKLEVPDFADGFIKGIGIGLMILALVMQKFTGSCESSMKN
jgi:hypothetical protein